MITIACEQLADIQQELAPLITEHWLAVDPDLDEIPLDVDWDGMFEAEAAGSLITLTARKSGLLVGYLTCFVARHHHYRKSLVAHIDSFWLSPKARSGRSGILLFLLLHAMLKDRGVVRVIGQSKTKPGFEIHGLFEYLGYHTTETLFMRRI